MDFDLISFLLGIAGGLIVGGVIFFILGVTYRKKVAEKEIGSAEEEAKRIINEAIKGGENKKREMLLEAKEEIHKTRTEQERENKERRNELQKQERRLQQKEEELAKKVAAVQKQQDEVTLIKKGQLEMLEKISGMTQEEAKTYLLNNVESEVRHETAMKIKEIEAQLKDVAEP